jgi:hypothetical protein
LQHAPNNTAQTHSAPHPAPQPAAPSPQPSTNSNSNSHGPNRTIVIPPPVVQPTPRAAKPSTTVSDPMQEEAVFNQPIDYTSLQAQDSPVYSKEHAHAPEPVPLTIRDSSPHSTTAAALSRVSSDSRSVDFAPTVDGAPQQQQHKRLPRKLTKNRRNSESNSERPSLASTPTEKTKGLLKKAPQRQSSTSLVEDGQKAENTPFGTSKDPSKRSSFTSTGSSIKDRLFPH